MILTFWKAVRNSRRVEIKYGLIACVSSFMWIFVWYRFEIFRTEAVTPTRKARSLLSLHHKVTVPLRACIKNVGILLKSDKNFTSMYRNCRNLAEKRLFLYERV